MTAEEIIMGLGGTKRVAKLCGVSPSAVSEWKITGIPQGRVIYLAAEIEKLTNGKMSRKDMFPEDWHVIWPELAVRNIMV